MGWEPTVRCPVCGDWHDVYPGPDHVCDCCLEILKIDAEQAADRYEEAMKNRQHNGHS